MDAIAGISRLTEGEARDKFIPIRKEDLFSALIKQGDFSDTAECELFRRFARTLGRGGQPAPVIACRVRDGHPPPVRTVRASGRGRAIYAVPAIAARRHARARNRR
jgi:hypothetical protein